MKRKAITITIITTALLATGVIAAATIPNDEADADSKTTSVSTDAPPKEAKRINVQTAVASSSKLTEYVTVSGSAQALMDVTFSAEIPGRVEYLGPELGRRVKRGTVLAKVDFGTLQAQKKQAAASYNLARKTHERLSSLGQNLVSRQKIDETTSSLENAKAGLEIAKDAAQKSVVRSNIRGVVAAKYVEEAEYVAPGTPLYRVIDHSTIIIEAKLPETQVSLIQKDALVTVAFGALDETRSGKVDAVLPTADKESRTFTVRIEVNNSDLKILQGMSATVKIAAKVHEENVVIPQDLVIENKSNRSVFVIEDGKAIERIVSLGGIEDDRVVILDGVAPGETLVKLGHRDLSDGDLVTLVN